MIIWWGRWIILLGKRVMNMEVEGEGRRLQREKLDREWMQGLKDIQSF